MSRRVRTPRSQAALALLAATLVLDAQASDPPAAVAPGTELGVIGPVYETREPDLLREILATLRRKEASGELARLQEQAVRRATERLRTPPAVPGVQRTHTARAWLVDPSVRFDEPILGERGQVMVAAGTTVNPLATVRFTRELLFFDGRDPDQVRYARDRVESLGLKVKPVLVGGEPLALMRQWRVQVYFDQEGRLVERFGIEQVPARVTQDGMFLRVEEVLL